MKSMKYILIPITYYIGTNNKIDQIVSSKYKFEKLDDRDDTFKLNLYLDHIKYCVLPKLN